MAHSIKNALLIRMKDSVEQKLPDQLKEPVERIVLAGMKLLYSPETHQQIIQPIYEAVKGNGFKPEQIGTGMLNLLSTISQAAQGKMPVEAAFPAGVILLCYVLDDLERTKGLTITQDLLTKIGSTMVRKFGEAFKVGGEPETEAPASEPPGLAGTTPGGMVEQGAM